MDTPIVTDTTTKPLAPHTICIVASVILFLVGGVVGVMIDPHLPASISNTAKGHAQGYTEGRTLGHTEGYAEAKNKIEATISARNIGQSGQTLIGGLYGATVTAISGGRISITANLINPLDDISLEQRTITTSTATKIVKLTQPSDSASFTTSVIKEADIKVGDLINVYSSSDVRTAKDIVASSIQVLPPRKISKIQITPTKKTATPVSVKPK